jgi:hypothetical protein
VGQQGQKKALHRKQWPKRESLIPVNEKCDVKPLVNPEQIYFTSFTIKQGLIKIS